MRRCRCRTRYDETGDRAHEQYALGWIMVTMNKVFLAGNLTRDPEVRYIPSGKAVADLRMAVTRKFRMPNGDDRQETCYVDVVVWERQAETCGEYLKKGSPVLIEGSLRFEEWEKNGEKRNRLSVTAERVQFLERPPKRDEYSDTPSGAPRSETAKADPPRRAPASTQHAPPAQPDRSEQPKSEAASEDGDSDNLPF